MGILRQVDAPPAGYKAPAPAADKKAAPKKDDDLFEGTK
jgi:hypothetical protein